MSETTAGPADKLRWQIGNRPDDAEVTVHVADLRAVLGVVDAAADLRSEPLEEQRRFRMIELDDALREAGR